MTAEFGEQPLPIPDLPVRKTTKNERRLERERISPSPIFEEDDSAWLYRITLRNGDECTVRTSKLQITDSLNLILYGPCGNLTYTHFASGWWKDIECLER